jgi:hypothetical protein
MKAATHLNARLACFNSGFCRLEFGCQSSAKLTKWDRGVSEENGSQFSHWSSQVLAVVKSDLIRK